MHHYRLLCGVHHGWVYCRCCWVRPAVLFDAAILQKLLFVENELKCILRQVDTFILGRKFRGMKELLEELEELPKQCVWATVM